MYTWDDESRKRVLGKVAQRLHDKGVRDLDRFSARLISRVGDHMENRGEFPTGREIEHMIEDIKTSLFRANRHLAKNDFASWVAALLVSEGKSVIYPTAVLVQAGSALQAVRINVDDIDSFIQIRMVSSHTVQKLVPLNIPEADIKQSLAQIIGEPFVTKDWGGEIADLFSTHVVYQGKRLASGFLLKGPGVKGTLTIKRLGKNGDQVVRLTSTSLDLYIVQFVGPIAQAVIDHLEAQVRQAAQKAGQSRYYCVIDGTDTARLLKAFRKL